MPHASALGLAPVRANESKFATTVERQGRGQLNGIEGANRMRQAMTGEQCAGFVQTTRAQSADGISIRRDIDL